jgi:hypothetical protein
VVNVATLLARVVFAERSSLRHDAGKQRRIAVRLSTDELLR